MATRRTLKRIGWLVLAALVLAAVAYAAFHGGAKPARDVAVALDASDPSRVQVGVLAYRGGLELAPREVGLGGISGLRWRAGRLYAVMDDGRWARFVPREVDGRLVAIDALETGPLLGPGGASIKDKVSGDAEALAALPDGGWLVAFEQQHRVWAYPALDEAPLTSAIDPAALFGTLADNGGLEALAAGAGRLFACAERIGRADRPNCFSRRGEGAFEPLVLVAPAPLDELGAVPTDADIASDGTIYVLLRSWSPMAGPRAAVIALLPAAAPRVLAILEPPLAVDNMEGLAIREEGERIFLYLAADDNFSAGQRSLLLKFELTGE